MTRDYVIRQATDDDVDELVRLREVMFTALGVSMGDPSWRVASAGYLRAGFARDEVAGFVADVAGRVVGGGVGIIEQRMPGPGDGRFGYIQSMATDPEHRGQGIAGGVVDALLAWFSDRGVGVVELHASAQGDPVYRARGFDEGQFPGLRWRRPG